MTWGWGIGRVQFQGAGLQNFGCDAGVLNIQTTCASVADLAMDGGSGRRAYNIVGVIDWVRLFMSGGVKRWIPRRMRCCVLPRGETADEDLLVQYNVTRRRIGRRARIIYINSPASNPGNELGSRIMGNR
jgi:hypothetical protein